MAEDTQKTCAEDTPAEKLVEKVEEIVEKKDAPAEETVETEEKVEAEDGGGMEEPETIEEVLAALRAKVAELTEEVAALKAAKAKLSGGLVLRKDAQAKAPKAWPELLKGIPVDQPPREYAKAYAALKAKHQAEYNAYMQAHATVPRCN